MTIVLQYQYTDLVVTDTGFSVSLSFNNIPENLQIPFRAITGFADPYVKFGLQFHHTADPITVTVETLDIKPPKPPKPKDKKDANNVVSLDTFRK
jgi:hypothetical protein